LRSLQNKLKQSHGTTVDFELAVEGSTVEL